ncbi:MAG TPA: aminotransferase class V-fold PLP-dependent enzyme [Cyclobacteriaceae bacterium]|nr:aminotransferase class V-fold PLP-dependent enzyme [Cyclobacteriaceae bacterium]
MGPLLPDEDLYRCQLPVEMDANVFREAGHKLIDDIAGFLSSISDLPVTTAPTPKSLQAYLPKSLVANGPDPLVLVRETWQLLLNNSLFNGHPKFWGYITSSPAPLGMLGDLMATAINSNCGAFVLSPMATEIEKQTIQWLGELIGFTAGAGIMVSGGNMANFIGFLAARKARADWDIRKLGLQPSQGKWRVYTSAETHTWISKAADLFGLGLDAIRWIPVDGNQRMNISLLNQQITEDKNEGLIPFLVVATAGSVGTGVVDPMSEIAAICKKHNCWFHIDGAYGGFAAALPELKELFQGIELADSVAIDPHKWLYSPLEAGCTLVKDANALTDAFSFHPAYYNFDGEEEPQTNFYESGLQNSRGFRSLKVWMVLRQLGKEGHIRMIREDIMLAKKLFEILKEYKEIETFTQHLSITTFRYRPKDIDPDTEQTYLNKLNQSLLNRLQSGGEVFLSNAVLENNYLLRLCIVNFRTRLSDIAAMPAIVLKEGRLIHEQMQKELSVKS